MRARALIVTLAACRFDAGAASSDAGPDTSPGVAWLPGYAFRKPVTVSAGAALAGFPVSVLEASDADLAAHAQSAADLAFTAADSTTVLPWEIVAYEPATGALDAWLQMTLDAAPTTAWLYYRTSQAVRGGDVWPAYAGVWHMSGTAGELDSTQHRDDATPPTLAATPASADGIIGGARSYDGVDDTLSATNPSSGALDVGVGSFSVELWVNAATSDVDYASPLWKGGSSSPAPGYDIELGDTAWHAEVVDADGSLISSSLDDQTTLAGHWAQLVAVADRSATAQTLTSYVDGAVVHTSSLAGVGSLDNAYNLQIGRLNVWFTGAIDEVRLIDSALTPEWIAAEYANATSRASFIAIGAEQTQP